MVCTVQDILIVPHWADMYIVVAVSGGDGNSSIPTNYVIFPVQIHRMRYFPRA